MIPIHILGGLKSIPHSSCTSIGPILIGYRLNMVKYARPRSLVCFRPKTEGGHISPYSVYNLFIVYPCFPINKLRLINLKSIFKTPKQSYSVSKNFSSEHRAVIFRHSYVATAYKVTKYNEFTMLGMLLMHLHRMCNNQLIAMPELALSLESLHKFTDFSTVLWNQRQCRRAAVCRLYSNVNTVPNRLHGPVAKLL